MESKRRVRPVVAVVVTMLAAWGVTLLRVPGASSPAARATVQPATRASLSDSPPTSATRPRVAEAFGKVPLYFVENRGQHNGPVHYYVQGRDTSVYFGRSGLTFALSRQKARAPEARPRRASWTPLGFGLPPEPAEEVQRWAVKLDFLGPIRG